jgi:signal transduction histidine kinase
MLDALVAENRDEIVRRCRAKVAAWSSPAPTPATRPVVQRRAGDSAACVDADRPILAAVVVNLLQNAFKFTRPGTTVTLRVGETSDRVLIEVEDACGGLPDGATDELFRPFVQRSADRTGLGLGLAMCQWGAEVNDGQVSVQSLPHRGCIFGVSLPRLPASRGKAASPGGRKKN